MRNLARYPITHEEKLKALRAAIDTAAATQGIGGIHAAALTEVLRDLETRPSAAAEGSEIFVITDYLVEADKPAYISRGRSTEAPESVVTYLAAHALVASNGDKGLTNAEIADLMVRYCGFSSAEPKAGATELDQSMLLKPLTFLASENDLDGVLESPSPAGTALLGEISDLVRR